MKDIQLFLKRASINLTLAFNKRDDAYTLSVLRNLRDSLDSYIESFKEEEK